MTAPVPAQDTGESPLPVRERVAAKRPGEGSDVETLLVDIWQRVLLVPEIDRDSNFFDLGGDSLFAVALFLEIERQLNVDLPVTTIYDTPTVAEMARLIERESTPESSSLVLLKAGTKDGPLFIVHGIGGTVFELAALGRAVSIPEPVYAIQARGLDGRDAPHETIGQMVDHYIRSVRAVQPFGPYRLCGYSFGGLIAMEMARRLKAQGQSIGALILIDAYAHPFTWPVLSRLKMKLRRSAHLFGRALGRSPRETLELLRARMKPKSASARLREWLLDQNPSLPAPLLRVREAGGMALLAYRPKPYAGRITFLNAKRRDSEFPDDPKRIWRRLALDIEFRTIPGGHRTIVTEYAEAAAAAITECLSSGRSGLAPTHHGSRFASAIKTNTVPALHEGVR